jgi:hypothetical protein
MALLLSELKARLAQEFDPDTILEILKITSEELVEAFSDRIEEQYEELIGEVDEEEWEQD